MSRIYTTSKPAILQAAVTLAREKGLTVFTRAQVAKATNMSEASINYHFKSTEQLRYAVAQHAMANEMVSILSDTKALTRMGFTLPNALREKIAAYIAKN